MIHAVLWIEGTPSPVTFHLVGHSIVSSKVSMNHWYHVHIRSKHWACPRRCPEETMASRKHHKTNKSSWSQGPLYCFIHVYTHPANWDALQVAMFWQVFWQFPNRTCSFAPKNFSVHVERHSIENIHDFPMLFPLKYVFPLNIRINHTQTYIYILYL
jgi:hypothetical protein